MTPGLHPRLGENVAQIERILATGLAPAQRVGALMANLADATEVLDGLTYTFNSRHYGRGLVYGDPGGRYSILALIWQPDQVTPLHAHRTWCAVTILSGRLTETTYELAAEGPANPREVSRRRLAPGDSSCDAGDGIGVHRIRNESHALAISLHVYGVPSTRIDDGINILLGDDDG